MSEDLDIIEAIKNFKGTVKFWACPYCKGSIVTWKDDVATCGMCGKTNQPHSISVHDKNEGIAGEYDSRYNKHKS